MQADGSASAPVRRLSPRVLLWAIVILVVGAGLGVVAFRVEQALFVWRPTVVATDGGWRIEGTPSRPPSGGAVSADHLAWKQGPYTAVLDLRDGETRVIGVAHRSRAAYPPALSASYCVWLEAPGEADGAPLLYAYEIARRRRTLVEDPGRAVEAPVVSGTRVAWMADDASGEGSRLIVEDLATGHRRVVARGGDISAPYLLAGDLIAWVRTTGPGAPFAIEVRDLAGGGAWRVTPPGQDGALFSGFALSGRTLVWLRLARRGAAASGQIVVCAVDTGATTVLVEGAGLGDPAIDGDLVVWPQATGDGAATAVVGRRLGGGSSPTAAAPAFPVAGVDAPVRQVMVSGATVAWVTRLTDPWTTGTGEAFIATTTVARAAP